jgi:DNA-binding beta-propeller fold protein YncE
MATPSKIPATVFTAVPAWCKGNTDDCLSSTAGSTPAAGPKTPRPRFRHGGVALTLICLLGLLLATSASAAEERGRVFGGSFGAGQLSLLAPTGSAPGSGVAVDDVTHDVYVADTKNHRVVEFTSAGVFVRAWGWGVTDGKAESEVCTTTCLPGLSGTSPGEFETPVAIAVDNSAGGEGDVYVAEYAGFESPDSHVQKFTKGGVLVKSWGVEGRLGEGPLTNGEAFFAIGGLDVDGLGNLWAGTPAGTFEFAQPDAFVQRLSTGGSPIGLALDAFGDLYAANPGEQEIHKFEANGTELGTALETEVQPTGLAFDPSREQLYVDEGSVIAAAPCAPSLSPLPCAPIARFGSPQLSGGAGIAVDSATHAVYAANTTSNVIDPLLLEPVGMPSVAEESLSEVTGNGAVFGGVVNPRSVSGEASTEYEFEYGPCASSTTCASSGYGETAPVPEGSLAPDFEGHSISVEVSDLHPQTAYHFRLVASNAYGSTPGEERTFTTQAAGGELVLPDERAWELVSPPDKHGARIEPIAETGVIQAAVNGGAITYLANTPTESQPQGFAILAQVLSSRGLGGWSSRDIALPHNSATGTPNGDGQEYRFFSPDLASSVVQPFGEFNPGLSSEATESTAFLHSLTTPAEACAPASSCYVPLVTAANVEPADTQFGEDQLCEPKVGNANIACGPEFLSATEDLSHVVLHAKAELKSGAGIGQLYEWSGGSLSPVSVLPGGEPAPAGAQLEERNGISKNGSSIAWSAGGSLYVRDMPRGETRQLESECQIVENSADELECALSHLTTVGGESAHVEGLILGGTRSGSAIYFVSTGVLTALPNDRGAAAASGQPNLYLRRGASTSFIATLAPGDSHDWHPAELRGQPTRASEDGQWLTFMSEAPLTGYDNRDVTTGNPVAEVYLYDAATNSLSCASCEPSGARPTGVEYSKLESGHGGLVGGTELWPETALVAANLPGWTAFRTSPSFSNHQPDYLSNSGRLFFNSADGLVSQDANGTEDVYEYEPPRVGDCTTASESFSEGSGGCVNLISSGSSAQESAFLDASENGSDVFFLTSAKLSPQDVDASRDVYDAHECTSESPCIRASTVQSPPCTTEASCKASPTPQPGIFGLPSSATFSGESNVTSAPAKVGVKSLTRAQKLAVALKGCKKDKKKAKRQACEKRAKQKYGAVKAKKKAKSKNKKK